MSNEPAETPGTQVVEGDGTLAIGITEPNPAFVDSDVGAPFEPWRAALQAIDPTYYRLVVEWADNVRPDGSFDPAAPQGGCMRTIPPCAGYLGIRDQLAAIKRAQERSPGHYQVLVTFWDTPGQFASAPSGCERAGTEPRSRPPGDLDAYRDMIRAVQAEASNQGVEIRYWSPWNEPNHAFFISPQRTRCDPDAPSASVPVYVALARALQETLEPGQEMVLAEGGGLTRHNTVSTELGEFIRALPDDLVCASRVFTQHAYAGSEDPVDTVTDAIATHGCPRAPELWITETGARDPDLACELVQKRLLRWYSDPRITAAFQYTLRNDDQFPTGLVTTDLTQPLPALDLWKAWGARPSPAAAPPADAC